jgi:hypothetical protein
VQGSDGNVGIGTSSPEATVHIQKASAGARGATLVIDNNATSTVGNESQITFLTDEGASVAGIANARIKVINTDAGSGAADLTFTTWSGSAEGERLRIDSSGNLGLGVVPSAWVAGVNVLDVGASGASFYSGGVTHNAYFDTTDNRWEYKGTGAAIFHNIQGGSYSWNIAPSGTAGDPITFTQAMTLDASGNVGIGLSSPTDYGATVNTLEVKGASGSGSGLVKVTGADGVVSGALYAGGSTSMVLSTQTNHALSFATNNTEHMTLDASGNLGSGCGS